MRDLYNPKDLEVFIAEVSRCELWSDPRVYLKAIRASLLALGYPASFVETKVRDILERTYLF